MGDYFEMLVDPEASLEDSSRLAKAVIRRFRSLGIITGRPNSRCVLGGRGYLPGPAVRHMYKFSRNEGRFWELATCGVEPSVGRDFNEMAFGFPFEGLVCPSCHFQTDDESFKYDYVSAADKWRRESTMPLVLCPKCTKKYKVIEWNCKPPVGFGNLSFRFWNWPPLYFPQWNVDIVAIVLKSSRPP